MHERSGSDWAGESDLLGWHPCAPIKQCGDDRYEGFVRNVIERRPGFATELFSQYVQADIGFVGKQEQLADDLVAVLRQQNLPFDEQRLRDCAPVNVSRRDDALDLPQELTAELTRLEYVAMKRYGYATKGETVP